MLLPYILQGLDKSSYQARLSSPEDTRLHRHANIQKITSHPETIQYLLRTYATTNVVNEVDNAVRRLRQHFYTVQEYVDELAEKPLRYDDVFDDEELMGIFVEGFNDEIYRSMQHYWSTHRSIRIYTLIANAMSIDIINAASYFELSASRLKNRGPVSSAR